MPAFRPAPELDVAEWLNTPAPIRLADLVGKVVVIEAFQMLCPGCVQMGLPQLGRVHEQFPSDDVAVLGLHTVFEHHAAQGTRVALAAFLHEAPLIGPQKIYLLTAAAAREYGEDEDFWRATALLHDFDYEIHPTLDEHPQDGAPILRQEGYPEELIESVLSHAEHLALPRDTELKKVLFACDELSGFVHACGLVRPTGLDGLEPKSVKKKLKQPSFAAGVHRDEVYAGAELLALELDEHIANVVAAMQPIARELGLRTAADAA